MIAVVAPMRVWVAVEPVDFRKGIDGLVAVCRQRLQADPMSGALFIFGAGPIKGFAVSLFWGVTISLYTAVVITKMIFDIRKGYQTLSI